MQQGYSLEPMVGVVKGSISVLLVHIDNIPDFFMEITVLAIFVSFCPTNTRAKKTRLKEGTNRSTIIDCMWEDI